jgi:hypothetical protein
MKIRTMGVVGQTLPPREATQAQNQHAQKHTRTTHKRTHNCQQQPETRYAESQ